LRFFDFDGRKRAKEDAAHGIVEILEFDVRRAWKFISCSGRNCAVFVRSDNDPEFLNALKLDSGASR
jgi:hypothetical protein